MTRLYLSLTDAPATAERDALSAAMADMPSGTPAEYAALTAACTKWAAMPTTVRAECVRCGREHDALWRVVRVPVGTLGHFAAYRLNGAIVLPDMSIPYTVARLPRDARPVTGETAAAIWHDDNESHTFGGPNVARALRSAIAAANGAR